jgi:hypothetical protein
MRRWATTYRGLQVRDATNNSKDLVAVQPRYTPEEAMILADKAARLRRRVMRVRTTNASQEEDVSLTPSIPPSATKNKSSSPPVVALKNAMPIEYLHHASQGNMNSLAKKDLASTSISSHKVVDDPDKFTPQTRSKRTLRSAKKRAPGERNSMCMAGNKADLYYRKETQLKSFVSRAGKKTEASLNMARDSESVQQKSEQFSIAVEDGNPIAFRLFIAVEKLRESLIAYAVSEARPPCNQEGSI